MGGEESTGGKTTVDEQLNGLCQITSLSVDTTTFFVCKGRSTKKKIIAHVKDPVFKLICFSI